MSGFRDGVVQRVFGFEGNRRHAATIQRLGAGVIHAEESVGIDNGKRQTEGRWDDAFASIQRRGIYE